MAEISQLSRVEGLVPVSYADGLAAAWTPDESFLITSPNVGFIPEIVEGVLTVHLCDNGAFGKHDPIQWPQVYVAQYPFLAAVPKSATAELCCTADDSVIWKHPTRDDFIELPNSPMRGFGRLHSDYLASLDPVVGCMSVKCAQYQPPRSTIDVEPLRQYEVEMSNALQRLLHTSATFRDQLLQFCTLKRYWLLCAAFLTFYEWFCTPPSTTPLPVNSALMGAWTSDPRVAQTLFSLGIPVWLVRASHLAGAEIQVARFVEISTADTLCQVKYHGDQPAYHGPAGTRHLEVTLTTHSELMCMAGRSWDPSRYRDISFLPAARTSNTHDDRSSTGARYRAPSPLESACGPIRGHRDKTRFKPTPYDRNARNHTGNAHPSQVRGRDKFVEVVHPWMPPSLPSWERAMLAVDRSQKARPGRWGYWIPEPGLLLGPKNPRRLQTYLMNWLRARPIWLYMLQLPDTSATRLPTQVWRDFLHGIPEDPSYHTKNGKRAHEIKQFFGPVFAEQDVDPAATGEVEWRDHRIEVVNDDVGPLVIWEICELGFRYELCALDRAIRSSALEKERVVSLGRIFPSDSPLFVVHLPPRCTSGLFASLPHHRIPSLNALQDVLSQWPLFPQDLAARGPLLATDSVDTIHKVELALAGFYTQTFFDMAGRAPIVPHRCPQILM